MIISRLLHFEYHEVARGVTDPGVGSGALLGIWGRSALLCSIGSHLRKPLDYVLDAPLPRLRRACLLKSLDDDPPCRRRSAIELGCSVGTKLQRTRQIGWE